MHCPWLDLEHRHPDITVARRHIAPARAAAVPALGVIVLDSGLNFAASRCALAHQVAHIDLCHTATLHPYFGKRQEAEATRLSDTRLLPIDALAPVLSWALSIEEVATELQVTADVVRRRLRRLTGSEKEMIHQRIESIEHSA